MQSTVQFELEQQLVPGPGPLTPQNADYSHSDPTVTSRSLISDRPLACNEDGGSGAPEEPDPGCLDDETQEKSSR